MKIKIIKRAAAEKIAEKSPAGESERKTDTRQTIETVKFWIDDLRQKRERERRALEELFSRDRFRLPSRERTDVSGSPTARR